MRLKSLFKKQAEKQVEKRVKKQVEKELGKKSLAYTSRVIRGLIPIAGIDKVRLEVIKGIEGDLKREIKKNQSATIEMLIADAVRTPDYMALLKDLGMGKEHLRVMAQEALDKYNEK